MAVNVVVQVTAGGLGLAPSDASKEPQLHMTIRPPPSLAPCRPTTRGRAFRRRLANRRLVGPRWGVGETRLRQGCPSKKKYFGMTTLDHRLYAWLLESNERRFELAFKAYFD